jgi:tRNA(Arg) A34 adenosine deaminase TadA
MHYQDPFDLARHIAGRTDAQITRYKHSSVILDRKGRVIGRGINHWRGRVIFVESEGFLNKTMHSEMHALQKVNVRRLEDATIIIYARTEVASILARPCNDCWVILSRLGFKKVFYTDRSPLTKPVWIEERF